MTIKDLRKVSKDYYKVVIEQYAERLETEDSVAFFGTMNGIRANFYISKLCVEITTYEKQVCSVSYRPHFDGVEYRGGFDGISEIVKYMKENL